MWRVTRKRIMKDIQSTRCIPYTTKSGLQIGIAYTPPPQQLTYEGEEIQSVLLGSRTPIMERRGMMIYAAIVAVVFMVIAVVVNK